MESRYNTLERNAYGVLHGRRAGAPGWTVVFRHKSDGHVGGCAVSMNLDGSEMRIEHLDIPLSLVKNKRS